MSGFDVSPYEVGKSYEVPIVRGVIFYQLDDWPVLGPWHDDTDVIGFENEHFHLDFRFLSKRQWKLCTERGESFAFGLVIHNKEGDPPEWRARRVGMRRRKCRRPMPEYPHMTPGWLWRLQFKYMERAIDGNGICPHRGAPLKSLEVDPDGCVTCPLHGLKWHCATGRLRPHEGIRPR